jgi:hypothetical protein
MKIRKFIAGNLSLALLAALTACGADETLYRAASGSKMRIEGTSTIHDWQAEGTVVGGLLKAGAGFPGEPGQAATPGKLDAQADIRLPIRSLTSVESDGKPYSSAMDKVMWEHLHEDEHPQITFHLTGFVLKEAPASKDAPYVCDATGELVINAVTNTASFSINVLPLGDGKLKITGTTKVKMTDFKVDPPNPANLGIKTGDDVKIIFTWMVKKVSAPSSAK